MRYAARRGLYNKTVSREDQIQTAVIRWSQIQRFEHGATSGFVKDYLFHIGNGGFRNAREAAKLKRMGVTAGVADLMLAIPAHGFAGLWIELKVPGGKLRPTQRTFLERMTIAGYATTVTYSEIETIERICDYLSGTRIAEWSGKLG